MNDLGKSEKNDLGEFRCGSGQKGLLCSVFEKTTIHRPLTMIVA